MLQTLCIAWYLRLAMLAINTDYESCWSTSCMAKAMYSWKIGSPNCRWKRKINIILPVIYNIILLYLIISNIYIYHLNLTWVLTVSPTFLDKPWGMMPMGCPWDFGGPKFERHRVPCFFSLFCVPSLSSFFKFTSEVGFRLKRNDSKVCLWSGFSFQLQ